MTGVPATDLADRRFFARGLYDAAAAAFVLLLAVVNAVLLPRSLNIILEGGPAVDWIQLVEGGRRVFEGDLYETTGSYGFRYSPVLAYVFAAIGWTGPEAWRLLHLAAALALPNWPMRLMTLAAWPFWFDVETGNLLTFVLLAAAWAIRGNRFGTVAFFALALLMPRPLMLPIMAWLLWKQPGSRLPFLAIFTVHLAAVVASGWGDEWFVLLTSLATPGAANDLGPSRYLGVYWLAIAIPLAGLLTWKGRLGWASVVVAYPYLLVYYVMMLVLEVPSSLRWLVPMRRGREARDDREEHDDGTSGPRDGGW